MSRIPKGPAFFMRFRSHNRNNCIKLVVFVQLADNIVTSCPYNNRFYENNSL